MKNTIDTSIGKTWLRYELREEYSDNSGRRSKIAGTNEQDEQKAIAELTAIAKERRKSDRALQGFIDIGKLGKFSITKCVCSTVIEDLPIR